MAAGNDARGTVLAREVDEGDDRRQLQLGPRPRHVAPHQLVAVQHLLVGARAPLQEVAEVELVAGAVGEQDPIADGHQQRVAHDVDGERPRQPRGARQLLGERPVEGLHHVVEELFVGVDGLEAGADLLVHTVDDVGGQQPLDDDGAVPLDTGDDVVGLRRGGVEALQLCRGAHGR